MKHDASLRRPRLALALLLAGAAGGAWAQTASTYNPNLGSVVVKKFYDANANGKRDTGEPWLSGWPMTLTLPNGASSVRNSTAIWSGLAGGSGYSVAEAAPVQTNWVQTAPRADGVPVNPKNFAIVPCKTVTVHFGNYCKKGSGGRTPGFWSNRNGLERMNDGGEVATELGLLSGLNLVSANGDAFDPVDHAGFRSWLLGGTATNMAYMLSVHLAAMTLNVESGLVNGDSYFLPCGCTVDELMEDANESLGLDPYTPPGHAERADQETLKNWLDQLNNGATVVSATPCARTFYPTY
ncbi:hypothetical protein [Vulcaniibacterium tengchongense]|uniref:Uncharacterized protein n=1 Tax=Vulcaniibacterium tengchongense TaxID=1273429 RepID=A0A3N4VRW7_9GAMM|nr:hypothetical protein [Vulcaniibacterium tengchongense]RPE81951.1 hypothetical protein EDC50_1154 [Vulcaniibacterium tengchongense]